MKLIVTVFILFTFYSSLVYSKEKTESFVVKIYDKKYKITSPNSFNKETTILIENKTLVKIMGMIYKNNLSDKKYVSILPGNDKAIRLNILKNDKISFVNLVPAGRTIELKFGEKAYEIPPKR